MQTLNYLYLDFFKLLMLMISMMMIKIMMMICSPDYPVVHSKTQAGQERMAILMPLYSRTEITGVSQPQSLYL